MRLWRLASARRARDFSGGYGLLHPGRWNTPGRPLTYAATVPSLAALEKRAHVSDSRLLPPQVIIEYEVPDDLPKRTVDFGGLPADWMKREVHTQRLGDHWLDSLTEALLFVPSVMMPIEAAPDRNVLINHRHARVTEIHMVSMMPFTFDPRLF